MRVLVITDWTANEGGIEVYVSRLCDGLRAAGDDVRLLTSSAGSAAAGSADYVAYGTDQLAAQVALQIVNPFAVARVRAALREFRPDVVCVNMFEQYLSPAIFLPLRVVPTVVMVLYSKPICPTALKMFPDGSHCTEPAGAICWRSGCVGLLEWVRDLPRYALLRAGLSGADRILACSRWMAEQLAANGIAAEPIALPVPAPRPGYRRAPASEPVFVYCGRFNPEKGVDLLLRAFARPRVSRLGARLRIIGDGGRRRALERLSAELGVGDTVEFVDRLPFEAVEDRLADAWALVTPSLWPEPLGLVAIEAITRDVPVIASASAGHAESVEPGINGLLFPNGDEGALAECLRAVATRQAFPTQRLPSQVVQRTRERHDLTNHIREIREIFFAISALPAL